MNILKRISGHVFFFYGMFLFLFFMLLIAVPAAAFSYLFREPRRAKIIHPAYKLWMSIVYPLAFCPVKRSGKHYFKSGENYVVVVNHNSLVDIPVSTPWIPGPNKTLAKVEFSKIPVFNIVYNAGAILVDRNSAQSRRESFTKMQQTLKAGLHLCLYPEGTRNKTDQPMLPFFEGAFITAIRSRKPVLPGVIMNTKKILSGKPKFWAWPHTIHYHFLPPVPTEGLTLSDRKELMDKVHRIMETYFVAHQK